MEMYDEEYDDNLGAYLDGNDEIVSEAEEDNTHDAEETTTDIVREIKPVKVKKPVLNPQPKLNLQALQGPKGLLALNALFKDVKFRGDGYEKEDLATVMNKLEQWAFRLYPKFHFEDSLKRLESLGKKREIHVYLKKIRQDMVDNEDVVRQVDDDDEAIAPADPSDDFDALLSQQISQAQSTQSSQPQTLSLSEEQILRIERNKQLALERRRLKEAQTQNFDGPISTDHEHSAANYSIIE